jgi:GNAT superfamily N-acetyltransferase
MKLVIRPLKKKDIKTISTALVQLGWRDRTAALELYLREQSNSERVIFIAELENVFTGYVTIKWVSDYPAFKKRSIPEIKDLNVLPVFRRRGIATTLLDKAEQTISERSNIVGIAVGMYSDYGVAQRIYSKRGYVPDGSGLVYQGKYVKPGQIITVDDDLVLYFTKSINIGVV